MLLWCLWFLMSDLQVSVLRSAYQVLLLAHGQSEMLAFLVKRWRSIRVDAGLVLVMSPYLCGTFQVSFMSFGGASDSMEQKTSGTSKGCLSLSH